MQKTFIQLMFLKKKRAFAHRISYRNLKLGKLFFTRNPYRIAIGHLRKVRIHTKLKYLLTLGIIAGGGGGGGVGSARLDVCSGVGGEVFKSHREIY